MQQHIEGLPEGVTFVRLGRVELPGEYVLANSGRWIEQDKSLWGAVVRIQPGYELVFDGPRCSSTLVKSFEQPQEIVIRLYARNGLEQEAIEQQRERLERRFPLEPAA
jgi:hypothetical protein